MTLNLFWTVAEIAVPLAVFLILGYLSITFISGFWRPAGQLQRAADSAVAKLEAQLRSQPRGNPQSLQRCFNGNSALEHAWKQYEETLHQPKHIDAATGEFRSSEARSTLPAELFFSTSTIVDNQVRADFFKHLPGISTGIGIIGTFLGLIIGLAQFRLTDNPQDATNSLSALLRSVAFAFSGSLCAIGFAMVTTYLERQKISILYGKIESIQKILDESFRGGVGEEYLERLVAASEESSSQTRILKDALVNDLTQILTELTDKQILASERSTAQLSHTIADTLREPLDKIAGGVNKVGEDQSAAVTKLLTDVLSGFSEKLEGLFGSQISGISDMQRRTIEAMEAAVGKLQDLTSNLETAGTRATDQMGERLEQALLAAETRQQKMGDAITDLLGSIRDHANTTGEQTQQHLGQLMNTLGERLDSTLARLEAASNDRAEEQRVREERHVFDNQTRLASMGEQVEGIVAGTDGLIKAIAAMTDRLDSTAGSMVNRLNSSSETLLSAANVFEKSGRDAAESYSRMAGVSDGLNGAATNVATATRSLEAVVGDFRSARDAITTMLETIKLTVETASREASLTSDIVSKIDASAQKLMAAQNQADRYLDDVTDVLAKSHQSFADGMRKTVETATSQFHDDLRTATGLLRQTIEDLDHALSAPNISTRSR